MLTVPVLSKIVDMNATLFNKYLRARFVPLVILMGRVAERLCGIARVPLNVLHQALLSTRVYLFRRLYRGLGLVHKFKLPLISMVTF